MAFDALDTMCEFRVMVTDRIQNLVEESAHVHVGCIELLVKGDHGFTGLLRVDLNGFEPVFDRG